MATSTDQPDSHFISKGPCPKCGSRDNLATYSDGHTHCFTFGCDEHTPPTIGDATDETTTESKSANSSTSFTSVSGTARALAKRGISIDTCAKFGYLVGEHEGSTYQLANYYKAGKLVAQHLRDSQKNFKWRGSPGGVELFGQHLWRDGGKLVVVTEGEIDCLTVSQLQGNKWPVVSIPNGAQSGRKALQANLDWLERFETVILMFDMDEPGKAAMAECAPLFTPGKCKVASLGLKDPNELLLAGRGSEVIDAIWGAKVYRPDGIVSIADLIPELDKPVEVGLSWPWPELTEVTYGIREDEMYALGAGTGMGKSEIWKEVMIHLTTVHNQKVGGIFLEESPAHTVRCLAGKQESKRFHVPNSGWTQDEFAAAVNKMAAEDKIVLYDHFGHTDYDTIKARIRYMVVSQGCKHIFLDHVTALASGERDIDERKELEYIMTDLASLVRELHITLYFISHLNTPEGKPHEEGGRVSIRHFKGSRAIGQWSSFMFGLERDQQEDDEELRHVSTFRVLKDRYTGEATGKTIYLKYDTAAGRLLSVANPFEDKTQTDQGGKPEF